MITAPRPEWSSFCEEARRTKKRERRADEGAQINIKLRLPRFCTLGLLRRRASSSQ